MEKINYDASSGPFKFNPEIRPAPPNEPPIRVIQNPQPHLASPISPMNPPSQPNPQNIFEGMVDFDSGGTPPVNPQSKSIPRNTVPRENFTYNQVQEEQPVNEEYEEPEYEEETEIPKSGGLKFAGVIFICLIVAMVFILFKYNKTKSEMELSNYLKANPSGGYVDATNIDSDIKTIDSGENTELVGNSEGDSQGMAELQLSGKSKVVTAVAKYEKMLNTDGRTELKLEVEDYGNYEIYIPHGVYSKLKNKGYVIVDVETVGEKVTYVYISQKNEKFISEILED